MAVGMFSYDVTANGLEGFQVCAVHPVHGTFLLGNFRSLQAAETFADDMRMIDAGPSHGAADYRIEALIRRNHDLIAAAVQARSDMTETILQSAYARAERKAQRV